MTTLVSTRLLARLGLISYGIFLWHLPVLEVVADWLHEPTERPPSLLAVAVPGLALTLVAAVGSFAVVERPLLALTAGRRAPVPPRGRHAAGHRRG